MVIPGGKGARRAWLALAAWALSAVPAGAQEVSEAAFLGGDDVTVLSASRLDQSIMDAPNAVTVLDRATIEATGYYQLSDLFRLVPGIYVGQKKGWFHNVSHTFADEYARRMQVLVDGRSVYLPSIGGVRWDTLPLAIDDIERIEVVRGPNAASFGANAMTGVINIITRHPSDVAGRMVHWVAGEHAHREGWFRWAGGGANSSHRFTLGRREDGGFIGQHDDERSNIASYRGEFLLDGQSTLGVQAGLLRGRRGEGKVNATVRNLLEAIDQPHEQRDSSHFLQADYHQELQDERAFRAKTYFHEQRGEAEVPVLAWGGIPPGTYYENDLASRRWHAEAQLDAQVEADLRTAFGGYLRRDAVRSEHYFHARDWLNVDSWGLFAHAEKRLHTDWLLNLGALWEDYELVGGRLSPRIALNWQPTAHQTLRLGVSRAYRNPVMFESRGDWRYTFLNAGQPIFQVGPVIRSSGTVEPEDILSHELSYFANWPGLTLDARLFHEHIHGFISAERIGGGTRDFFNTGGIRQKGLELQVKWRPRASSQVLFNYAFLHIDSQADEKRYSPGHLAGMHWMHEFPGEVDLTLSHYWVDDFEPIGQSTLPASRRWDARLSRRFSWSGGQAEAALGVLNAGGTYREFDNDAHNAFDTRGYVHLKVDF